MRTVGVVVAALALAACGGGASEPARGGAAPPSPSAPPSGPEDRFDFASAPHDIPRGVRVHLIDVGQGAATLFELSCGAVLIDTGGETDSAFDSGDALSRYLDAFFAHRPDLNRTLDLLVVTHPHADHAANVKLVVEGYAVKHVVTDGRTSGSGGREQRWLQDWARRSAKYEAIDADEIPPGGRTSPVIDPVACADVDPHIRALWGAVPTRPQGWTEKAFSNENNHSVVLRVDVGKASFLVSGDLEIEGAEALVRKHRSTDALDVDVWEMSHHGSYNGTSAELVRAMTPSIGLVAMGPHERHGQWTAWAYGHPRKDAIEILAGQVGRRRRPVQVDLGVGANGRFQPYTLSKAIYGTGWDGNVVVSATADGEYRVQTTR